MSETAIEWTDRTWNPIVGCSIVSPGCTNCYAMKMAGRLQRMNRRNLSYVNRYDDTTMRVNGKTVWSGLTRKAPNHTLLEPLGRKVSTRYFVNSMGDLFHENIPDDWIDDVFAVIVRCPQHTFQVLTKRPERMLQYITALIAAKRRIAWIASEMRGSFIGGIQAMDAFLGHDRKTRMPLKNLWLGVSAERQQEWDERVEILGRTPAALRFVSVEPMLGPIDCGNAFDDPPDGSEYGPIDWIICGGESGPGARPMHPDWARSLRDQCQAAKTPFFFKQWGEHIAETIPGTCVDLKRDLAPNQSVAWGDGNTNHTRYTRVGKKAAGRLLDGREHNDMPDTYNAQDDFVKSRDVGFAAIRVRMAQGGPGWNPK